MKLDKLESSWLDTNNSRLIGTHCLNFNAIGILGRLVELEYFLFAVGVLTVVIPAREGFVIVGSA